MCALVEPYGVEIFRDGKWLEVDSFSDVEAAAMMAAYTVELYNYNTEDVRLTLDGEVI
jgi:hypothetical protein